MKKGILLIMLTCVMVGSLSAQAVTTLTDITANGGVSIEANGNIIVSHFGPLPFVAGEEGTDIFRISQAGEISTVAENVVRVGTGNTVDSQGFIYQGSFQQNKIVKLDPAGNVVDDAFFNVPGPVGLTIIENDTLVVCSCNTNAVFKVAQDGFSKAIAGGAFFSCANGVTKDEVGNIYTTNFSDPRVTKITPAGVTSTLGITTSGNGHIAYRAADDMLYIASYGAHQIFQMDMMGNSVLFAGTGVAGALDAINPLEATFSRPNGIAVSSDGCSLYITQDEGVMREIKFADNGCTTGVELLEDDSKFDISPNPVADIIRIKNYTAVSITDVQIVDINGKIVSHSKEKNLESIDVSELITGSYFLRLTTMEGQTFVKQIIVL